MKKMVWRRKHKIEITSSTVNDELAFIIGVPSTLNAPSFSVARIDGWKKLLGDSAWIEMGYF